MQGGPYKLEIVIIIVVHNLLEVYSATMRKFERFSVDKAYVTGFVPSNLIKTEKPKCSWSIWFLQPLSWEVKDGLLISITVNLCHAWPRSFSSLVGFI